MSCTFYTNPDTPDALVRGRMQDMWCRHHLHCTMIASTQFVYKLLLAGRRSHKASDPLLACCVFDGDMEPCPHMESMMRKLQTNVQPQKSRPVAKDSCCRCMLRIDKVKFASVQDRKGLLLGRGVAHHLRPCPPCSYLHLHLHHSRPHPHCHRHLYPPGSHPCSLRASCGLAWQRPLRSACTTKLLRASLQHIA